MVRGQRRVGGESMEDGGERSDEGDRENVGRGEHRVGRPCAVWRGKRWEEMRENVEEEMNRKLQY